MQKNVTHNRCYAVFDGFRRAMLGFLKDDVPENSRYLCDSIRENFRVVSPPDFRILTLTEYIMVLAGSSHGDGWSG